MFCSSAKYDISKRVFISTQLFSGRSQIKRGFKIIAYAIGNRKFTWTFNTTQRILMDKLIKQNKTHKPNAIPIMHGAYLITVMFDEIKHKSSIH